MLHPLARILIDRSIARVAPDQPHSRAQLSLAQSFLGCRSQTLVAFGQVAHLTLLQLELRQGEPTPEHIASLRHSCGAYSCQRKSCCPAMWLQLQS